MNRATKKKKYLKLYRFFLFAQISTLIVAVTINTILLLPNDFKTNHKKYKSCLEKKAQQKQPDRFICTKPYLSQ